MIKIPGQYKLWRQTNVSDIKSEVPYGGALGELWTSTNIDPFEIDGKIRLGKKMILNSNTNDTNMAALTGVPIGFRLVTGLAGGRIYTAAGSSGVGGIFRNPSGVSSTEITAPFAKMTTGSAPTDIDSFYSDIDVYRGQLFVTKNSSTAYYMDTSEVWHSFNIFGSATSDVGRPKMLTVFNGRMYCTWKGFAIVSWDDSGAGNAPGNFSAQTGQYSLDLSGTGGGSSDEMQILWMRAASNRIWIGVMNRNGGKGYVYTWDGASNQATAAYRMESSAPLSCVIKDDVPYLIDIYGNLLKWNGGTFTKVAQLNMASNRILFNSLGITNNRFIHPNGMAILYGQVSALIDGRNYDGTYGPPDTFTQLQTIPSGVWQYSPDSNTFIHKHSLTTTHASDAATKDYGQLYLASNVNCGAVGALAEVLSGFVSGANSDGSFLAGGSYSVDHGSSGIISGIWYDNNADSVQKAGSFVTGKIFSGAVTDTWQKLFVVYKKLLTASDRIVLKYRLADVPFVAASDVKFPTTSTLTTATNPGSVGDEVEIVAGINSGICAHITAISLNAGLYTVTIDEAVTVSTPATSRARFQPWIKLGTDIHEQVSQFKEFAIGKASTHIQFKAWMLFTGANEISELIISNEGSIKA